MAAKETPRATPITPTGDTSDPLYNPATDPNKTAQERLDALTEQQRQMHAEQAANPEYPVSPK